MKPEAFASPIIHAPDDPRLWPDYRETLSRWRADTRKCLKYDGSLYVRDDFQWASKSFACCFLMLADEAIYDRKQRRYLLSAWLEDGLRRFGGYDSVVLWHAYPRIGLDQRNQFDFYRDMPGGLDGLRRLAWDFQGRGVRVYIDYNPWDGGTRREGMPDLAALTHMVSTLGVDGIFLDTM